MYTYLSFCFPSVSFSSVHFAPLLHESCPFNCSCNRTPKLRIAQWIFSEDGHLMGRGYIVYTCGSGLRLEGPGFACFT